MYILDSFTEVDILCFWLHGIKENFVSFSQKKSKPRLVTLKKS